MDFISTHFLSLILFLPALAAVFMLFLPKEEIKLLRWFALGASLIPFLLSVSIWFQFKSSIPGFQFQERYEWYEALGSTVHLGVDGLSLTMVLLTTLLTPSSPRSTSPTKSKHT
jgi:NADH-quinone oxidoreductase subunit M